MREHEQLEIDRELSGLEKELQLPLSSIITRSPRTEETRALIYRLQGGFDALKEQVENPFNSVSSSAIIRPSLLHQCLLQLRSYHKSFWVASAVLFTMMTLISEANIFGRQSIYTVVIPLFMIGSLIYSYRVWNAELRMVESVTPYPPALLLLSRMLIVLAQCIGYGLLGTLYLQWTASTHFSGFLFMLEWLSLVFFISGVMAYVMFLKTIRWGVSVASIAWLGWKIIVANIQYSSLAAMQGSLLIVGILLLLAAYRKSLSVKLVRG